ncbi:hypothetical protein WBG78_05265 [Chryseolinea sp. T2]|uniref:hypothetical protein n=1 Tax=Chryseolinea sp. T2 TaxID=3129255 RepID=UPI003078507F
MPYFTAIDRIYDVVAVAPDILRFILRIAMKQRDKRITALELPVIVRFVSYVIVNVEHGFWGTFDATVTTGGGIGFPPSGTNLVTRAYRDPDSNHLSNLNARVAKSEEPFYASATFQIGDRI